MKNNIRDTILVIAVFLIAFFAVYGTPWAGHEKSSLQGEAWCSIKTYAFFKGMRIRSENIPIEKIDEHMDIRLMHSHIYAEMRYGYNYADKKEKEGTQLFMLQLNHWAQERFNECMEAGELEVLYDIDEYIHAHKELR